MNRRDFQALTNARLAEAQLLHEAGFHDGAYYLAGYAVECALKARIARRTRMHDFPPTPQDIRRMYTHSLSDLVRSADLTNSLADRIRACRVFEGHWDIAIQWSEESRYLRWTDSDSDRLLIAITDPQHGVLRWLREHW